MNAHGTPAEMVVLVLTLKGATCVNVDTDTAGTAVRQTLMTVLQTHV